MYQRCCHNSTGMITQAAQTYPPAPLPPPRPPLPPPLSLDIIKTIVVIGSDRRYERIIMYILYMTIEVIQKKVVI